MKKKLALALTAIMALSAVPAYAGVPAAPTASKVTVNGAAKAFEAYNINSNNYFKLRDIAYVLNGTDASFSVGWDGAANSIALAKGEAYAPTGSEMKVSGTKDIKDAVESKSTILIDGKKAALKAYTIKGNNYFKLRDLGTALGFQIGWDNASQTISITTEPSTVVKPTEKEEKTTLTWEEAEKMGLSMEIVGIWASHGLYSEMICFADDSPFKAISVNSATVNGKKATAHVYTAAYLKTTEMWSDYYNDADFFLQYTFPDNAMYSLNADPYSPDYGKRNDVSVTYSLQTKDGKVYTLPVTYNMLSEGNGGLWIE